MQISDIKVGEKYRCSDSDTSTVLAVDGDVVDFTDSTGYQFSWGASYFAEEHKVIEPKPEPEPAPPKTEHTEATCTALDRLERVRAIVEMLDGLTCHEVTSTLLAVADALHCPIREQTAAEFRSFPSWDADGDTYSD